MAVPFGVGAPIATALIGGGPATMIWGYTTPIPRPLETLVDTLTLGISWFQSSPSRSLCLLQKSAPSTLPLQVPITDASDSQVQR